MYDLGLGVLVFNPYDDEEHLQRIEHCLQSLINAIHHNNQKVKLFVLMNRTVIGKNIEGVGRQTRHTVTELLKSSATDNRLVAAQFPNSMDVAPYHRLQTELHRKDKCKKVVVFADDYIIPHSWIETVFTEFRRHKHAEFLTPASIFVPQQDLLVPVELKPKWKVVKQDGRVVGIAGGVSGEDVENIAMEHKNKKAIRHFNGNSFETTVWTDLFLSHYGYIYPHYFSIWYNNEYFDRAKHSGARGIISYSCFVFHYGKGGTSALYRETRDEKYEGSPAEKYLIRDVDMYNKRNAQHIGYWWQQPTYKRNKNIPFSDLNKIIEKRIKKNYWRSFLYNIKDLFFNKSKE